MENIVSPIKSDVYVPSTTKADVEKSIRDEYLFLNDPTLDYIRRSKVLFIMRGLPGCGKTTTVQVIAKSFKDHVICSADDYFSQDGEYKFDPEKLGEAHDACKDKFSKALKDDKTHTVIVDNTNIKRWEYGSYVRDAFNSGFVIVVVPPCSPKAWDTAELAKRNTHGVDLETLERKKKSFEVGIPRYWAWFANKTDTSDILKLAEKYFQSCIAHVPEFDAALKTYLQRIRADSQNTEEQPSTGPLQFDEVYKRGELTSPLLHCTSMYGGRRACKDVKCLEYHKQVSKLIGGVSTLTVVGFVFSPRTAGARIYLNGEQLDLWQRDDAWDGEASGEVSIQQETVSDSPQKKEKKQKQKKQKQTKVKDVKQKGKQQSLHKNQHTGCAKQSRSEQNRDVEILGDSSLCEPRQLHEDLTINQDVGGEDSTEDIFDLFSEQNTDVEKSGNSSLCEPRQLPEEQTKNQDIGGEDSTVDIFDLFSEPNIDVEKSGDSSFCEPRQLPEDQTKNQDIVGEDSTEDIFGLFSEIDVEQLGDSSLCESGQLSEGQPMNEDVGVDDSTEYMLGMFSEYVDDNTEGVCGLSLSSESQRIEDNPIDNNEADKFAMVTDEVDDQNCKPDIQNNESEYSEFLVDLFSDECKDSTQVNSESRVPSKDQILKQDISTTECVESVHQNIETEIALENSKLQDIVNSDNVDLCSNEGVKDADNASKDGVSLGNITKIDSLEDPITEEKNHNLHQQAIPSTSSNTDQLTLLNALQTSLDDTSLPISQSNVSELVRTNLNRDKDLESFETLFKGYEDVPLDERDRFRPTAGKGCSAHLTLGVSERVQAVQTGIDQVDIVLCERIAADDRRHVKVDGAAIRYYGEGRCVVYLDTPLKIETLFTGSN